MKIFMENRHRIAKHNAAYEQGIKKFKLALNKYGDMVNMNSKSHWFFSFPVTNTVHVLSV
jgi:hypothetical protein